MRRIFLGSLSALLASAGLAVAEPPVTPPGPDTVMIAAGETPPAGEAPPADVPPPVVVEGAPPPGYAPWLDCGAPCMCGTPHKIWFSGEYLMWWMRQNQLPPILTSGPAASRGILNSPGTVVIGGADLDNREHSGARFTLGGWFTDFQGFGIEGTVFFLESKGFDFGASGTGAPDTPVVARPFFNVLTGQEDARVISFPTLSSGTVLGTTFGQCEGSSRLFGAEFNFIGNLCCEGTYRTDLLIGYRYLSLQDRLRITDNSLAAPFLGSAAVSVLDRFDTSNYFNGGQIGTRFDWRNGRWMAQAWAKIAVGQTSERVDITGATAIFPRTQLPLLLPGGLYAVRGNSGQFTCDKFAVVPELGVNLGVQVCDCLTLFAGYTFLYWSEVARSGDQINRNVNPLEVPAFVGTAAGVAPHAVTVRGTDFWAHGLNVGFELRY
jgi:hypothetical protein